MKNSYNVFVKFYKSQWSDKLQKFTCHPSLHLDGLNFSCLLSLKKWLHLLNYWDPFLRNVTTREGMRNLQDLENKENLSKK